MFRRSSFRNDHRGFRQIWLPLLVVLAGLADAAPRRAPRRPRAAIDTGSNSVTIAVTNAKGKVIFTGKVGTELGEGRVGDGPLGGEAQDRTYAGIEKLVGKAMTLGVAREDIDLVMTAAARDAIRAPTALERLDGMRTGEEFLARVKGLVPSARILTEDEEADLGFFGALRGVSRRGDPDERFVVVDTGGGSHQVTIGTRKLIEFHGSRKVGSFVVKNEVYAPLLDGPADGDFLARVDEAMARRVPELPTDADDHPMTVSTAGATLVLTGGFAHFVRIHFGLRKGREKITRGQLVALRRELESLDPDARMTFIREHHDGTPLSPAELTELGFDEGGSTGGKLPIKATLVLHILKLLDRGDPADVIRLSTTDVRHHLLRAK